MSLQAEAPAIHHPHRVAGWRVVARKEFADHVRSVRFVILLALITLAGIGAVYSAAGGIRDVAERATGAPNVFLAIFYAAPERIPPFSVLLGWLGPLLGIAFGFDAVNGERAQGTLPRLVSQPIYRDDIINGKFVAGLSVIGMVLGGLMVFLSAIGMLRLGVVPAASDVVRLLVYFLISLVYVGLWLAFATLCSVYFRRAATSALLSIAVWLVLTLFSALLIGIISDVIAPAGQDATPQEQLSNARMQQTLGRLSPATLYEEGTNVVLQPLVRATGIIFLQQLEGAIPNPLPLTQSLLLVWPQVTLLVALTVISFGAAYVSFMRQEVRA